MSKNLKIDVLVEDIANAQPADYDFLTKTEFNQELENLARLDTSNKIPVVLIPQSILDLINSNSIGLQNLSLVVSQNNSSINNKLTTELAKKATINTTTQKILNIHLPDISQYPGIVQFVQTNIFDVYDSKIDELNDKFDNGQFSGLDKKADLGTNGKVLNSQLPNILNYPGFTNEFNPVKLKLTEDVADLTNLVNENELVLDSLNSKTIEVMTSDSTGFIIFPGGESVPTIKRLINPIKADLASEINRAKAAETSIQQSVTSLRSYTDTIVVNEKNRAKSAEIVLQQAINSLKLYTDNALTAYQSGSSKFYVTLAAANADIANIMPKLSTDTNKDLVNIGELTNGGVWYKAAYNSTSLTKSPYDVRIQANEYTDTQINELGIENNNTLEKYSVQIVDEDNTRTWLEADERGEPTNYSTSVIGKKVGIEQSVQQDFSVQIVDDEDKRTWLEADGAGKPTEYATQCIAEALQMSPDQSAQYYKSSYQDKVTKIVSGPNIVCWGDSMTAGAGAVHPYSYYLQQLLIQSSSNAQVRNCGVGGEGSDTICARQGGNPFLVKVNSGIINADASQNNPITLLSQGGTTVTPSPLLQGSGNPFENIGYFKGDLYGISGQIHPLNGGYVFVRDESGSNITANRPTYFYTNYSKYLRDSIAIIWIGQNSNPSVGLDDLRAIQDAKAMIRHLKTLDKRYLVINKPISTPEEDKVWYAEFGDRYIPARAYLMEFGLADAGLTPTQQDLDSIAAGYVPNSLRFDNVHWNDYGYEILANLIFKKLKQLEWV